MLKINKQINKLPNEIQLLILNFYNYKKEYFVKKVLPNILLINRINNYYDKDEFIYLSNLQNKHFLINVSNILYHSKNNNDIIEETVLNNVKIITNVKNIWIRINITSIYNYFGGTNNSIIEILYINKYNYNIFAIKTIINNNINISILQPITKIKLHNYCNYYSCENFMHLPENAINVINKISETNNK